MRRISICGVDGSGKTTLLKTLRQLAPRHVPILHAPQYFDGNQLSINEVARAFEALGTHANEQRKPALKACSLFLSMSLYGAAETELGRQYPNVPLIRERDPIVDSLTYSQFYLALLNHVEPEQLAQLDEPWLRSYLAGLRERVALGLGTLEPQGLPAYINAAFRGSDAEILAKLEAIYQTSVAEVVLVLQVRAETLGERLRSKLTASSQAPEHHEQLNTLLSLQRGLFSKLDSLSRLRALQVEVLNSEAPPEVTAQSIIDKYLAA